MGGVECFATFQLVLFFFYRKLREGNLSAKASTKLRPCTLYPPLSTEIRTPSRPGTHAS
jgi:hypothetical protein